MKKYKAVLILFNFFCFCGIGGSIIQLTWHSKYGAIIEANNSLGSCGSESFDSANLEVSLKKCEIMFEGLNSIVEGINDNNIKIVYTSLVIFICLLLLNSGLFHYLIERRQLPSRVR